MRRIRALRETIGPDVRLMVDANEAYNATTAIRIGHKLADLDLMWFEEPVNAQDIEAYLQVKDALPMAIAGGENLRTRFEFKDYLARRAYDIAAGHHALWRDHRNGAHLLYGQRIRDPVNPHVWGSPIMIAATLHLTATLPPPHRTQPTTLRTRACNGV